MGGRAPHVVVVGGGIVGASIAFHLSLRGARVTVVEQQGIGAGATGASFAWANAALGKEPRSYWELHRASLRAWRDLATDLGPELGARFGGTVEWLPPGGAADALRAALGLRRGWGTDAHEITVEEVRRLVPGVEPGPVGVAVFSPGEAAIEPVAAAARLLSASGAELADRCQVRELLPGSVVTDAGRVACDRVVLACGVETARLAEQAGIHVPLVESLGALAHTAPVDITVAPVVLAPGVHLLGRPDGRVVIGTDFGGLPAETVRATSAEQLVAAAARFMPALADAEVERLSIGERVLPADGLPILGPGPGSPVYVAAMHSGVSLAPIVGRLVAQELLGTESEELAPYRPARFAAPG